MRRTRFSSGAAMAPRSFWKGYLKLSLVTCPVSMSPALSESEKVRFHTLNRETGNRDESIYVDADTGDPMTDEEEVKGYPAGPDNFVTLEDEEIASVALESTRTIDIETFVPRDSIPWIWHDRPHYLVPDDKVGEEAFSVIRDAMAATDTAGIARLVLYRRERAVMLVPRWRGIVVWTLRYGDEVRDEDAVFEGIEEEKLDPTLMGMMTRLIDDRTKPWDPAMVTDPVQNRLLEIIAAKKKGKAPPKAKPAETPKSNVVNIMDALKRSIEAEKGKGKGR
jgi:DNA end-binding protein Ku